MHSQSTSRVCHIPRDPHLEDLNAELSRARWEVWHPTADELADAVRELAARQQTGSAG
jgi:hypothetical protein